MNFSVLPKKTMDQEGARIEPPTLVSLDIFMAILVFSLNLEHQNVKERTKLAAMFGVHQPFHSCNCCHVAVFKVTEASAL